MAPNSYQPGFPSTRWSLIESIRSGTDHEWRRAVEEIAQLYWRPVYAWLRSRGLHHHDAAELTQGFFETVILQRDLLGRAERGRGRLRTLILTALERFWIDDHRRSRARGDLRTLTVSTIPAWAASIDVAHEPKTSFEQAWAIATLDEAIRRTRAHFLHQKPGHWKAFEMYVLVPTTTATSPPSMESIASTLGFPTRQLATSAVQVVRKRIQATLQQIVSETCGDEVSAQDEIAGALAALGG